MDATQLKAYRDKLRATENNIAIRLYCDNGIIIDKFIKEDLARVSLNLCHLLPKIKCHAVCLDKI